MCTDHNISWFPNFIPKDTHYITSYFDTSSNILLLYSKASTCNLIAYAECTGNSKAIQKHIEKSIASEWNSYNSLSFSIKITFLQIDIKRKKLHLKFRYMNETDGLLYINYMPGNFHIICSSVASVCERTIPTERPPPVGEVSANFCG